MVWYVVMTPLLYTHSIYIGLTLFLFNFSGRPTALLCHLPRLPIAMYPMSCEYLENLDRHCAKVISLGYLDRIVCMRSTILRPLLLANGLCTVFGLSATREMVTSNLRECNSSSISLSLSLPTHHAAR
jgi:hypothetical protein